LKARTPNDTKWEELEKYGVKNETVTKEEIPPRRKD
jgi:hypothetical protein